jgi:hypothetical protein
LGKLQVQARNQVNVGDGWGTTSAAVNLVTSDGYPSSPVDLQMASRSETCITVRWSQPLSLNGLLISYQVRIIQAIL